MARLTPLKPCTTPALYRILELPIEPIPHNRDNMNVIHAFSTPVIDPELAIPPATLEHWRGKLSQLDATLDTAAVGNQRVARSEGDFFYRKSPACQEIAALCHREIARVVSGIGDISPTEFQQLRFDYQSWLQVTQNGGFQPYQNFPNATWCGYLCIYADTVTEDEPESGVIVLHDPRVNANQIQDDVNSRYRFPVNHGGLRYQPKSGDMLIFPAYLPVESFAYLGDTPRMMVWFSAWIREEQGLSMQPLEPYHTREVAALTRGDKVTEMERPATVDAAPPGSSDENS